MGLLSKHCGARSRKSESSSCDFRSKGRSILLACFLAGTGAQGAVEPLPTGQIYIREYRVDGARQLPRIEIEEAVYPYLGPGRTQDDVEQARAALEKAYRDKGYQAVSVQVPQQQARGGIVTLQVLEGTVGRLRVKGSRYFSLDKIKDQARSIAEGKVVNFNDVTRDIVSLNTFSDRRITPTLRAGAEPGTVDIDLEVKDTFPLHGSIELNNRYSPDTTRLRLNGSLSYTNLWQLGHSIGASFQISPEDLSEVKVYSGYYSARFPNIDWLSLVLQATRQESNVSTLSSIAVAGRGEVIGARAIITLPTMNDVFHSVSLGIDYKHFDQNVMLGPGAEIETPITYYPLSATYSATRVAKGSLTELNAGITFNLRGVGSDSADFDNSRFKADGAFIYFRGDFAHTRDLPLGFQVFGKVQGQLANQPLISSEQFTGGGLGTTRGYLEAEVVGDNAIFGSVELRSPPLLAWLGEKAGEWRVYAFLDGGEVGLNETLPEQEPRFDLASYGVGSRIQLFKHLNSSIDAGFPLVDQANTMRGDWLLTFRVWADF